jgi:molybdopterin synthase catalytic subunit
MVIPHLVEVVPTPLKLDKYLAACEDSGAGAIATFIGVTRDNFQGKRTLKLDYECYAPMAEKKLEVTPIQSVGH